MRTGLLAALALLVCGCLGPDDTVPPGRDAVRTAALAEADAMRDAAARAVPADLGPHERALFRRRGAAGAVWAATPVARFDLTGVAWSGGRGVLVTDRHVLGSAHVPGFAVGDAVTFFDADGWPIERRLAAVVTLPALGGADLDTKIGRLDAPVPSGVTVYALPEAEEGAMRGLAAERAPVLVTFSRGGRTRDGEVGWGAFATLGTLAAVTNGAPRVIYARGSDVLEAGSEAGHAAMWGDSGSPSFLVQDDALLLLSHYHTSAGAGAGPNYADARVQALIEKAIAETDAAVPPAREGGAAQE